jgi:hypothetical protein
MDAVGFSSLRWATACYSTAHFGNLIFSYLEGVLTQWGGYVVVVVVRVKRFEKKWRFLGTEVPIVNYWYLVR